MPTRDAEVRGAVWGKWIGRKGELSAQAKYTEKQVLEMRAEYDTMREANGGRAPHGAVKSMANRLAIPYKTLRMIVGRINWKHIP